MSGPRCATGSTWSPAGDVTEAGAKGPPFRACPIQNAYEPLLSAEMMSPNSSQFLPLNLDSCIDSIG